MGLLKKLKESRYGQDVEQAQPTETQALLGGAMNFPVPTQIEQAQPTETQQVLGIKPNFPVPQIPAQTSTQVQTPSQTQEVRPIVPQTTRDKISTIENKDYSKGGKDRDKNWSTWEKISNAVIGGLMGLSTGGIGGGIVGAVQGGTDRNFDEKLNDRRQLGRLYPQMQRENEQRKADVDFELRQAQVDIARQKPAQTDRRLNQQQEQIELRRSRQEFQKLNAEQKQVMQAISKRGYYKEGENVEEDKRLEALGIVLPDFDSRPRKYIEQAGQYYEIKPDNTQVKLDGIPVDQSEVPVQYTVNGKNLMMRPRDIANIESANQRQQNELDDRAKAREQQNKQFMLNYNQKVQADLREFNQRMVQNQQTQGNRALELQKWKAAKLNEIEKAKAEGDFGKGDEFNQDLYNQMKSTINGVQ